MSKYYSIVTINKYSNSELSEAFNKTCETCNYDCILYGIHMKRVFMGYKSLENFPIICEYIPNNKIGNDLELYRDVITGKEFWENNSTNDLKNSNGIFYIKHRDEISIPNVADILRLLTKEDIERYKQAQEQLDQNMAEAFKKYYERLAEEKRKLEDDEAFIHSFTAKSIRNNIY